MELDAWQIRVENKLDDLSEKTGGAIEGIGILVSHVIGNGVPGLVQRQAVVEAKIAKAEGTIEFIKWSLPVVMALGPVVGVLVTKLVSP